MPYKDKKKQKEAQNASYLRNKEKVKKAHRKSRKQHQQWFAEIKSALKCKRCPENHPFTLDFHHLDETQKIDGVANMVSALRPKKIILAEIDKCIVLCANCHRKLHYDLAKDI